MAVPPAFAAGALYDTLLQGALRQFFGRAQFQTEPTPSVSSDGRLAIEPTGDPAALTVRWFGSRHTLTVPERRPFTEHETRFARSIASVLAARYRAIFNPRLMAERGDLFRGSIEDRYVGAFLDPEPYAIDGMQSRADRIAAAIEVLRVAGLSTYENRPISSGVLLLASEDGRIPSAYPYSQALTTIKSFYRLCDGLRTLFLVNREGFVIDIVDVAKLAAARGSTSPAIACAESYRWHAAVTHRTEDVCIVLSPSHEIKVFAEGVQVFAFRQANWQLLDVQAKYEAWAASVGDRPLAERLFQTALDLADAREGALFVVLRAVEDAASLIAAGDRLDIGATPTGAPSRRDLLYLLADRTAIDLDATVLRALATMDGATVMDRRGRLLAAGAILMHGAVPVEEAGWVVEGARTTAAMAAARYGPVLKISEDGVITFFDGERIWDL
jgi:hypothetical protein